MMVCVVEGRVKEMMGVQWEGEEKMFGWFRIRGRNRPGQVHCGEKDPLDSVELGCLTISCSYTYSNYLLWILACLELVDHRWSLARSIDPLTHLRHMTQRELISHPTCLYCTVDLNQTSRTEISRDNQPEKFRVHEKQTKR